MNGSQGPVQAWSEPEIGSCPGSCSSGNWNHLEPTLACWTAAQEKFWLDKLGVTGSSPVTPTILRRTVCYPQVRPSSAAR